MADPSTAVQPDREADGGQPSLKRVMGPGLLLLFIVGDILGTGIYALTGAVAAEVGGAVWLPFLVAFAVAMLTAFSYLELVTKYPRAAGAALYTHKAFGVHFVTFIVAFAVMSSGLTSSATASKAFANNFAEAFGVSLGEGTGVLAVALGFILLIAAVNFRGVGESVKANVVLTCVELSGLLIIIGIGMYAFGFTDDVDFTRLTQFDTESGRSVFTAVTAATALAFFAMVGFEDSVNMAEETQDPSRIFPKIMIWGLCITGTIYILVSITAVAVVPLSELAGNATPLLTVVEIGFPGFPLGLFAVISIFAVANSALINMLMASRLVYGMAREAVLPTVFGKVHPGRRTPWVAILFTTALACGLIALVDIVNLGSTTALLLLCVFAVVNVAVLVLRKDTVDHDHFTAPTPLAVLGAVSCAFLASPLSGRPSEDYEVAGVLLAIGVVLWAITWMANRALHARKTYLRDPEQISGRPDD